MVATTRFVSAIATTYDAPVTYRRVRGFVATKWDPLGGVNTVEAVSLQLGHNAPIATPIAAGNDAPQYLTIPCGVYVPWDGSDVTIYADVATGAAGFVRLCILTEGA